MIIVPKRFNYAEAYLTLRCNFGCEYCINNSSGVKRNREELTGQKWIDLLNDIDFGELSLTLGGGEPTMHPDFFKILQGLRKDIPIDLLTNLSFDVDEFIALTNPDRFTQSKIPFYHPIRISYHPGKSNREDLVLKAKKLQKAGFNLAIFAINHPHNINKNMAMANLATRNGIFNYTKDFLGEVDGRMYGHFKYPEGVNNKLKCCSCRTKELLIDPEGKFYRCHRDLYKAENPIDEIEDIFRPCVNYGDCNLCDVKLKSNKFLDDIDCQVEIQCLE